MLDIHGKSKLVLDIHGKSKKYFRFSEKIKIILDIHGQSYIQIILDIHGQSKVFWISTENPKYYWVNPWENHNITQTFYTNIRK